MSDEMTVNIGSFTLINEGYYRYKPDWDAGDRIVDERGNPVTENDPRLRALMNKLGLATFNGADVKWLDSYLFVLMRETAALQNATEPRDIVGSYEKIVGAALELGVPTSLDFPFTELAITAAMAQPLGQDIAFSADALRRLGYPKAVRHLLAYARQYAESQRPESLGDLNRAIDSALSLLDAKDASGAPLFGPREQKPLRAQLEAVRTLGSTKEAEAAIDFVERNVCFELKRPANAALAREERNNIRRNEYVKEINVYMQSAPRHRTSSARWIPRMNGALDVAIALVRAKAPRTNAPVFPADVQQKMLGDIEAVRREEYREAVAVKLREANGYLSDQPSGWKTNALLALDAAVAYIKAKVPGKQGFIFSSAQQQELLGKVEEIRRKVP